MRTLVAGLYKDSELAGEAVAELKQKGYTQEISVMAYDEDGEVETHEIKTDASDGTTQGAAAGGIIGALTGMVAGVTSVTIPTAGLLVVGGPLAILLGLGGAAVGAAVGALAGGLVGALVDLGFPQETAEAFEAQLRQGEVLVSVATDPEKEPEVKEIMNTHGVSQLASITVEE